MNPLPGAPSAQAALISRLGVLRGDPSPRAGDLASLMRDSLALGDARTARAAFDHAWGRLAQPPGGKGPPGDGPLRAALMQAILACASLGDFPRAFELWQTGVRCGLELPGWDVWKKRALNTPAVKRSTEALAAAMAEGGLVAARGLLESWLLAEAPDWVGIALAADALDDAVLFLRAEEGLGIPFHEADPRLLPDLLLRAGFQARLRLMLLAEAGGLAASVVAMIEGEAERDSGWERRLGRWRLLNLQARAGTDAPEHMLERAGAAFAAGDTQSLRLVARCLSAMNEGGRLKEFLTGIGAGWVAADRRPLLEAQVLRALHDADGEEAARLIGEWEASHGCDVALLALKIRVARKFSDTATLERLLQLIEPWCEDSARAADLLSLGPALALACFSLTLNWARVERLVRSLADRTDLSVNASTKLAHVFSEAGHAADGTALLRRSAVLHPRAPGLWQALIKVHLLNGDAEGVAEAKRCLLRDLPERLRPHMIAQTDPRCWNAQDVVIALRQLGRGASAELQDRIMGSLPYAAALRSGLAEAILRDHALPPRLGATLTLLGLRAADSDRMEQAVLGPVPLKAFEQARAQCQAQIEGLLAAFTDVPGAPLDTPGVGLARTAAHLARLAKREGALLDTAESYASALSLARFLISRIRAGAATSVVRVGDGEGLFLPWSADPGPELDALRQRLRQIWWGERQPSDAEFERMVRDHQAAVDRADVVGTIPLWRVLASFDEKGAARGNWRGCCNAVAYADGGLRRDAIVTSAHLHHDLHHWNLWREIFGEIEEASWICCHELGGHLLDHWGVRTRIGVMIPGETRFFGAFGRFGQGADRPEGLVDRHEQVRAALRPQPGEVWLVAAGFLGKIYCDDIRQRGGIALDIGSLADYWMGYVTRGYGLGRALRTNLTNTLIEGTGIAPPQDRARLLGPPGPVRSTRSGRYNIGLAEPAGAASGRRFLLEVIGHPRCASGYMAGVFARNGVEIGHERHLRDGVSSWMNVVRDAQVPYGNDASLGHEYALTVIHARDPAQAIASIILENGVEPSFDFRRQHILRETGDDIAAYPSAVARAVASYVGWYEIALRRPRARLIRIEEAERDVPRFLGEEAAALLAWRSEPHVAPILAVAPSAAASDEEDESSPLNTSARKFSTPKPSLFEKDFASLELGLRVRFLSVLARLGYAAPFGPG